MLCLHGGVLLCVTVRSEMTDYSLICGPGGGGDERKVLSASLAGRASSSGANELKLAT